MPNQLPVITVRTFVGFVWIVDSQVALEMCFSCEHLGAEIALEQHFRLHVSHLNVHLQYVLILRKHS